MKKVLFFSSILATSFLSAQNYYGTEIIGESGNNTINTLNRVGNKIVLSGLIGGSLTGNFPITFKGGLYDGVLTSISATDGNIQWIKQFGGGATEIVTDATMDSAGNYYVTGTFDGSNTANALDADPGFGTHLLQVEPPVTGTNRDIFIIKLNANGDFVWAKHIGSPAGALGNDDSTSIKLDSDGNIYIAGSYVSLDFDPGPGIETRTATGSADAFILKLDLDGDFVWVKTLEGTLYKRIIDMEIDAQNNLFVTGWLQGTIDLNPDGQATDLKTTVGNYDTFVAKYNSSGGYLWGNAYGGTAIDKPNKIHLAGTNVYVGGAFNNTVDLDPGTGTNSFTSTGGSDAYVSKFNTDGTYMSSYVIAGSTTNHNNIQDIIVDANGNHYLAGAFGTSLIGTNTYTSAGLTDNFYLKLNSNMDFSSIYIIGNAEFQTTPLIQPLTGTQFVGVGTNRGNTDFDYTANISTVTGSATANICTYLTKFDFEITSLGVKDIAKTFDFSIYPIPVKNDLNIQSDRKIQSVSIFSMDGKRVYGMDKQDIKQMNISMLPIGTYILQVKDDKGNVSQTKFIKN